MEKLDQGYLNDLTERAKAGSSNAFAELFAAVSGRQYLYLVRITGDEALSKRLLTDVFVQVSDQLVTLSNAGLLMPWISRISWRCAEERITSDESRNSDAGSAGNLTQNESGTEFALSQILNLPLGESQIMLMHEVQGLAIPETSEILNIGNGTVRKFLKLSRKHMQGGAETAASTALRHEQGSRGQQTRNGTVKLSSSDAVKILEEIYERTDREANTVPMDALTSYTVYRKERFTLQRGVLIGALIVFLLIPVLFILPKYEVSAEGTGERGLPVYTVRVNSLFPVHSVTASVRQHTLPVYEADAKTYTIEPVRNGEMTIRVELFNRQELETTQEVSDVDANGPELIDSVVGEDSFTLYVKDAGIGVDYREVYAISASGEVIEPLSADEENGIVFSYPEEAWDVYIPDHIGNTLHLSIKMN